jgi:archaeosine synthase
LVVLDGDPETPVEIAPFSSTQDDMIPANMTFAAKMCLSPPFAEIAPNWESAIGHVLPPSLDEADVGEVGGYGALLPVSWQRICHDLELKNPDLNPQVIVLTDALQLASRPSLLPEALHTLRLRFPGALLWTPGIGGPDNAAVLTWMGVDIFDLCRSRQAHSIGAILTADGARMPEDTLSEIADDASMTSHWSRELANIRRALRDGTLRDLVEKRIANSPRLVEHLRYHDNLTAESEHTFLESIVSEDARLQCNTFASRSDPAILDWIRFIDEDYCSPSEQNKVLILLPCSARKPYRFSRSHRRFLEHIRNSNPHQVMVTAPLGLVPRDLERIWPACHYDIPVTGDWDNDELARIESMVDRFVTRQGYEVVINHSGIEFPNISVPIIDTRCGDSATAPKALQRLGDAVDESCEKNGLRSHKRNNILMAEYRSTARRQMSNDEWMEGLTIVGRPPRHKLMLGEVQLAQWNPERGALSLTKSSLPILHEHQSLPVVEISHEGSWSGDIFSHMVVDYDPTIRMGADLLVLRDGVLIGSARASIPGGAWPNSPGRLARSHHRLPAAKRVEP